GEPLEADTATLVLEHPAAPGSEVRFGTLRADGSTRWGAAVAVPAGALTVSSHLPAGTSIGLSAQVVAGALPAQRAVITVDGHPYELAGSLSSALTPGPWLLAGFSQGYAVFTLRKPAEPIVAATATGRRLPVQVLSSTTKSEQIRLQAPSTTQVVRSVAWDSGWSATVSVNGGKAKDIPLNAFDLVQRVHIPAGDDVVSFHYRPRHLLLASVLSVGASVFLLALLGVWLARLFRRRGWNMEPDADMPAEPPSEDSSEAVPECVG
ncbi:MAG TPA: hypothetical protein VHX40_02705, partial [Acidimicrobiales bacterium]|nr:hypothetical protein [Acidimicrobiales bacterium]